MTTGRKNAVAAVLLMNALSTLAAITTTTKTVSGLLPEYFMIRVSDDVDHAGLSRAALRISSPRIMITVSLPNPSNARSGGMRPEDDQGDEDSKRDDVAGHPFD